MERCSCARGEQGGVASARVGGAVDYAWYLRPSEGSGAHGAWLYGDVESAVGEVFPAEMSGCACYGLHFGVGGYVAESFGEVVCACYYCVFVGYDGAYWYFSFLCGLDGFGYSLSHESLVALPGCLVEHVACVFLLYWCGDASQCVGYFFHEPAWRGCCSAYAYGWDGFQPCGVYVFGA